MQFIDHNTDLTRLDTPVKPLLSGLLANTQIYDAESKPKLLTQALKHRSRQQDRRNPDPYDGEDPFISAVIDIFGFDPLDFQVNSWTQIRELDQKRRTTGEPHAGVFAAPTGFGKTEAFLGALYQLLISETQESVALVYPRTALLQDQLGRILKHVHAMDADLTVGVYMGDQPWKIGDLEDKKKFVEREGGDLRFTLTNCWCGDDEEHAFYVDAGPESYQIVCENNSEHRFTERDLVLSREEIAHRGVQPDILLTTLESLELFSLKPNYDIIDQIDTVVLDEMHMYTGLRGAHAAQIIQNLNEITKQPLLWLGASATIDSPKRFSKKLFDLPPSRIATVEPPESDFKTDHDDKEHFYFLITDENGPTVSALMIQQMMLIGHAVLGGNASTRTKALSFIDSKSQVNQKYEQLIDAEQNKQLWQYHRTGSGYENWDRVAKELSNADPNPFWEKNLTFQRASSDHGFDASAATDTDILLSTSFLEVGIDVGTIEVVAQYRTPRELSSFIQRSGRAAREEGMDSHVLVFLSNLTGDANMFYRADRFLDSELRTPLKPNNDVVEWIHGALRAFYTTVSKLDKRRYRSRTEEEAAFFEQFLSETLGFHSFTTFLTEPDAVLDSQFETTIPSAALQAPVPIAELREALDEELLRLEAAYEDIEQHISIDSNTIGHDDAVLTYIASVEQSILDFIQECDQHLETLRPHLPDERAGPATETLEGQIEQFRIRIRSNSEKTAENRIITCRETLTEFGGLVGSLSQLRMAAEPPSGKVLEGPGYDRLSDLEHAVTQLDALDDPAALRANFDARQEIYHLRSVLDELDQYFNFDEDGNRRTKRPFESLYYVKSLLRSAYYFNRFLNVRGEGYDSEVWYVPPNYFDSSGQYVTVRTDSGKSMEKSIDSLVHTYAPLRSEYQGGSQLRVFMPETTVDEDTGEVLFDFSGISGENQNQVRIPDQVSLTTVTDRSSDAKDIIGYCPDCYQILEQGSCPRHGDVKFGKVHADPQVQTTLLDRKDVDQYDRLALMDVRGQVTLDGVTLEITPAVPSGDDFEEFVFTGGDKIHDEIVSPEPPLGFTLDTRGLVFDISGFLEEVTTTDAIQESTARYKDLERIPLEELSYHTAAHFFLQLVADVSGVDTSMLFYGMDRDEEAVYVFERTEGGQGLSDLVFDEVELDPGNMLESLNRIGYNTQVMNERLWATETFVRDMKDIELSEEAIQDVVQNHVATTAPFAQVQDQLTQEVLLTADRARQLAEEEAPLSQGEAYDIKHVIATAQVAGDEDFPTETIAELDTGLSNLKRARTRFLSPDIDGCVENLHVSECISGHDQEDTLSYILLEVLREGLVDYVPHEKTGAEIFEQTTIPAGELENESIFLRF